MPAFRLSERLRPAAVAYFSNPALFQSIGNSLFISVVSTAITTTLARARLSTDKAVMWAGLTTLAAFLLIFVAFALHALLSKSFQDRAGKFVGLSNYPRGQWTAS